jgi:hypothetical protein
VGLEQGENMSDEAKVKAEEATADTQTKDSEKNALSPKELGEISGGRASNDPCEGGQIR